MHLGNDTNKLNGEAEEGFSNFDDLPDEDFFKLSDEELNTSSADDTEQDGEYNEPDGEVKSEEDDTGYSDSDDFEDEVPDDKNQSSNEPETLSDFFSKPLQTTVGEITVNSKEELMQLLNTTMTAYKTLESMSPDRETLQLLKDNNLTNLNDINHVLDIMSGNPDAIKKLILDKKVDIDLIDFDEDSEYKPTERRVNHKQVEFTEVAEELKQTTEGQQTLQRVNAEWDDFSKEQLVNSPNNLRFLAQHIKDGSYDRIQNEVKRRKMLGTLSKSISTVQAYFTVGEELFGGRQPKQTKSTTDKSGRDRVGRQPKLVKPNSSPSQYSMEELDKMSDSEYFAKFKG